MQQWTGGAEAADPTVLQVVVATSKAAPVDLADLYPAVVAVVAAARDARPEPFAAYEAERIRKLARHTTPARTAALVDDDEVALVGVSRACRGSADVLAVGPLRRSATPRRLASTQLSASPDRFAGALAAAAAEPDRVTLRVVVNPALTMSPLKLVAQVGHAAQLTHRLLAAHDPGRLAAWRENGWAATVVRPVRFEPEAGDDVVVVRDAGFTEIPAGSLTVWARTSS